MLYVNYISIKLEEKRTAIAKRHYYVQRIYKVMQRDYTKIRRLADFLLKTMQARRQTLMQIFKILSKKKTTKKPLLTLNSIQQKISFKN